jgi:hypothetical protein
MAPLSEAELASDQTARRRQTGFQRLEKIDRAATKSGKAWVPTLRTAGRGAFRADNEDAF